MIEAFLPYTNKWLTMNIIIRIKSQYLKPFIRVQKMIDIK